MTEAKSMPPSSGRSTKVVVGAREAERPTWFIRGDGYACCSCSVGCPCATGELQTAGSIGCSAVQIMEIQAGEIAGTSVGGAKVAAVVDWPGPMMAGDGTGRLYFDVGMSKEQCEAVEALLSGKLGGVFAAIPALVPTTLPPKVAPIERTTRDDAAVITVGGFGEAKLKPMHSSSGELLRLQGAGGFRDDVSLATGTGSWWHDPELRQWEGGGYAERSQFSWNG